MFALLNMFNFLAVYVSTVLLISKYNQTLPFTNRINTPPAPTGKVPMDSVKERKYCNTKLFFFLNLL